MPVRSLHSSVLVWPDRATVDGAVRRWASRAALEHPEIVAIGYFGSYATGSWGVGSDVDLIVRVEDTATPMMERGRSLPVEELPVPADLLVYTESEWAALRAEGGRFAVTTMPQVVWVFVR